MDWKKTTVQLMQINNEQLFVEAIETVLNEKDRVMHNAYAAKESADSLFARYSDMPVNYALWTKHFNAMFEIWERRKSWAP